MQKPISVVSRKKRIAVAGTTVAVQPRMHFQAAVRSALALPLLALSFAVPTRAFAQSPVPLPALAGTVSASPNLVSRNTALLLGIGATIGPMFIAKATYDEQTGMSAVGRGAMLAGLALGPSVGYLYARRPGYALLSGLGKATALAVGLTLDGQTERQTGGEDDQVEDGLSLGMVMVLAVAAWDVADLCMLPGAVEQDNLRRSRLAFMPMVATSRGPAPGMAIASTF